MSTALGRFTLLANHSYSKLWCFIVVRPSSPDLAQTSVQYVCLLERDHRHQYNSGRDKFRLTAVLFEATSRYVGGSCRGGRGFTWEGGALGPKCACVVCRCSRENCVLVQHWILCAGLDSESRVVVYSTGDVIASSPL